VIQAALPVAVGEQAVVADFDEAFGQDVQGEAAEELGQFQRHFLLAIAVGVVAPAEGDFVFVQVDESTGRDGDAVGVAAEVVEDLGGTAEGGFAVDVPRRRVDPGVGVGRGTRVVRR
jgi:hypothetical protein